MYVLAWVEEEVGNSCKWTVGHARQREISVLDSVRFHQAAQDSLKFKTYDLKQLKP